MSSYYSLLFPVIIFWGTIRNESTVFLLVCEHLPGRLPVASRAGLFEDRSNGPLKGYKGHLQLIGGPRDSH